MKKLAIAIDIGGTNIKAGVIAEDGELMAFDRLPANARKGFSFTFGLVSEVIGKLIDGCAGQGRICGIGCATAGQVDHIRGKVVFATDNIPGLGNFELGTELRRLFDLPVAVHNDVNAVALGERWLGAAKDLEDFVCLTLGTGIGGAIYRNGGLDYGANDIAGELGHMVVNFDGPPCNCGNRGCFEKYGSASAFIEGVRERLRNGEKSILYDMVSGELTGISGEMIFEAGEGGDRLASDAVEEYIGYLSVGIASLLHILNPGAVIIGGGISRVGGKLIRPLEKAVKARAMPRFTESLVIAGARLGDTAGLYGAVKDVFSRSRTNTPA